MIDSRTSPFLLPIVPLAVLCGVFAGLTEAEHHHWAMGVLGGLCVGTFIVLMAVILTLLGDMTERRLRLLIWGGLLLATAAGYLTGTDTLSESAWPVRWALPLLCLLPLPLTWAAVRVSQPTR